MRIDESGNPVPGPTSILPAAVLSSIGRRDEDDDEDDEDFDADLLAPHEEPENF